MKSRLGEINIVQVNANIKRGDISVGSVRLLNPAHLNRYGQKFVREVHRKIKGIEDVIVTDEFIILDCGECTEKDKLKKLAHSYMLALESKLMELDEEQMQEIIGEIGIGNSMAVHSTSGIFHTEES